MASQLILLLITDCLLLATDYLFLLLCHPLLASSYSLLTIHCSLLATCYLLLATSYFLTTCDLLLATHRLVCATCYLLLATYYSLIFIELPVQIRVELPHQIRSFGVVLDHPIPQTHLELSEGAGCDQMWWGDGGRCSRTCNVARGRNSPCETGVSEQVSKYAST